MATIRKRKWESGGEIKTAWIADYADAEGKRRLKTFKTKKDADAWLVKARGEVARGTHVADSASVTVAEAAELWLTRCERDNLEQSTMAGYRSHVTYHIKPLIGGERLCRITAPRAHAFVDELLAGGRSRALVKKILGSLSAIISEAQRRGLAGHNPVREAKVRLPKRDRGRPEMPTKEELRVMLTKVAGHWRPLIVTAMFTGLRSSELRALLWSDVDIERHVLHVRQRVDQWGTFGPPKSEAGTRDIPLPPIVVNTLREWKLACPKRDTARKDPDGKPIKELHLVFPNGRGKVESHANILHRGFHPLQLACGIGRPKLDKAGKPVLEPKYSLHALRHAAAALFIEQGFGPKRVQAVMGHASIQMTFDLYGYLFESREDDRAAMQQIEARLLA